MFAIQKKKVLIALYKINPVKKDGLLKSFKLSELLIWAEKNMKDVPFGVVSRHYIGKNSFYQSDSHDVLLAVV